MGSVYRQKGRANWLIKFYRDGRPIIESTGTDDKTKAANILRQREGAVADGRPVLSRGGKLKFDAAAEDVINDYEINGKRSIDGVKRRIRLHLTPFFGGRRMVEIDTALVRSFIKARLQAIAQ